MNWFEAFKIYAVFFFCVVFLHYKFSEVSVWCTCRPLVIWRCWLGDKKGIWHVKEPALQIPVIMAALCNRAGHYIFAL